MEEQERRVGGSIGASGRLNRSLSVIGHWGWDDDGDADLLLSLLLESTFRFGSVLSVAPVLRCNSDYNIRREFLPSSSIGILDNLSMS